MVWVEYGFCFNVVKVRGINGKSLPVVEVQLHIYRRDSAYEQNISLTDAMEKSH